VTSAGDRLNGKALEAMAQPDAKVLCSILETGEGQKTFLERVLLIRMMEAAGGPITFPKQHPHTKPPTKNNQKPPKQPNTTTPSRTKQSQ